MSILIKNQKTTINPINKNDNKCFQYATTVVLNHEEIGTSSQRISKIQCFISKYNWEGINYLTEKDDWEKFEKINLAIALNVLYAKRKEYILTMFQNITQSMKTSYYFNGSKQRNLALYCDEKVSALLRQILSKRDGNFYCFYCLNHIKKYVKIKILKILKY